MQLITPFLKIQNQLRIFHWQSDTYAQHKAFGKAYENFDGLVDDFVEVYMGKNGKVRSKLAYSIEVGNFDDDYITIIDSYISYLHDLNNQLDQERDSELLNIRDEMLAVLNRLKYLLSLA
jgi:hypothetical protein